jgi:hypothetical protein
MDEAGLNMASTPVEPDLEPHSGITYDGSAPIVPLYQNPNGLAEAPPRDDGPPRRRFPFVGLLIVVALSVIVVLVSVTFARFIDPPSRDVRASDGPAAPPGPQHTVTGPLGSTQAAEFQLAAGVSAVVVKTVDLGSALYRATTPTGSGFVPRVAQEGDQVKLRVVNVLDVASSDTVTMELNQRVKWRVTLIGGSESASVDLRTATLAGVDFTGGVAKIELWLPKPQGEVTVKMSGGARDFLVHAPRGVPVRVSLARGAATVTIDGAKRSGVGDGTKLVPAGWDTTRDRYVIDAVAGLASLTVDRPAAQSS